MECFFVAKKLHLGSPSTPQWPPLADADFQAGSGFANRGRSIGKPLEVLQEEASQLARLSVVGGLVFPSIFWVEHLIGNPRTGPGKL